MTLSLSDELAVNLRRLAWLIEHGSVPGRIAERLTRSVDDTMIDLERTQALLEVAALMPGSSRWATAGGVAAALERFQTTAWPRIKAGYRLPHTPLETACTRILAGGDAPCQRSIWNLLRESQPLNSTVQLQPDTMPAI